MPENMRINVNSITPKLEVDNRIPLRHYYRIADNLLRQANVHREERNIVDLYVMLLRFSSLVSETIPPHQDYPTLLPKEKSRYKKKMLTVLDELEALKPEFQTLVEELNKGHAGPQLVQLDSQEKRNGYASGRASVNCPPAVGSYFSCVDKQSAGIASSSPLRYRNDHSQTVQLDKQFQKFSLSLPIPRQETLSRHSILGPNGLQVQWLGPSANIRVQYPSSLDFTPKEDSGALSQPAKFDAVTVKDSNQGSARTAMESVLSLDNGMWSHHVEESLPAMIDEVQEDSFKLVSIKQPSPPPVLVQLQQASAPIPPSQVADPRPGPAKSFQDFSDAYHHLHVPVNMMEDFLRLARGNTTKNLETCGILAGSLKNRVFHITTLIIPKQESTSDSCQTVNEEEIFEVQDRLSLFPLGWIHTHPSQTCFMSSVDLHTHYSYQIMLPEAIAIVMAPTDTSSPHGIFHLSDPSGVNAIRNCQERGFHPHEEPSDGSPIYEHCSHVYMNSKLNFDVIDLR